MFVDLQTAFLMSDFDVIVIFPCVTLYLLSSTGSLIIAIRPKYKEVYLPTMLVQSYATYGHFSQWRTAYTTLLP